MHRGLPLIISVAAGLACCAPVDPDSGEHSRVLRQAPLSPAFLAWRQEPSKTGPGGYHPPPVDLSHMRGAHLDLSPPGKYFPASTEPSFDLRKKGVLPPIRSQGRNKSCWVFPPIASLESNLLPGERWDLSEDNLRCLHGFDLGPDDGGNALMAVAYMARLDGPVLEADDPYPTGNYAPCTSPAGLPVQKRLTEVLYLPDRTGPLDNATLKTAVKAHGPIVTCMHYHEDAYDGWGTYYYPQAYKCTHNINIIGWDDDYAPSDYYSPQPKKGAFIFRNSWSVYWGKKGYGYISYYDAMVGVSNYIFTKAGDLLKNGTVYQHDPLGWINSVGYGSKTAWMANVFTAKGDEPLHSVSFYATSTALAYEVSVYDGVGASSPGGTARLDSRSGSFKAAGYYTVKLADLKIRLRKGRKFSVVVKLTTPSFDKPIAIETPVPGYSSKATAAAGESFVSPDGSKWTDLVTVMPGTNVCLKAFSGTEDPATSCGSQTYDGDTWQSTFTSSGVGCRPAPGRCDVAESCTGLSSRCPEDKFKPASKVCRVPAGACDAAERCSGTAAACPADVLLPAGTICRVAGGECDLAERCSGSDAACPADQRSEGGVPCADGLGSCLAGACVLPEDGGCSTGGGRAGHGALPLLPLALLLAWRFRRCKV